MSAGKKKKMHVMVGKPLKNVALAELINEAERGPFYTSAQIKKRLKDSVFLQKTNNRQL